MREELDKLLLAKYPAEYLTFSGNFSFFVTKVGDAVFTSILGIQAASRAVDKSGERFTDCTQFLIKNMVNSAKNANAGTTPMTLSFINPHTGQAFEDFIDCYGDVSGYAIKLHRIK